MYNTSTFHHLRLFLASTQYLKTLLKLIILSRRFTKISYPGLGIPGPEIDRLPLYSVSSNRRCRHRPVPMTWNYNRPMYFWSSGPSVSWLFLRLQSVSCISASSFKPVEPPNLNWMNEQITPKNVKWMPIIFSWNIIIYTNK